MLGRRDIELLVGRDAGEAVSVDRGEGTARLLVLGGGPFLAPARRREVEPVDLDEGGNVGCR